MPDEPKPQASPEEALKRRQALVKALMHEKAGVEAQLEHTLGRLDDLEEVALRRYAGYESELAMLRHEVLRLRKSRRKALGRPKKGD